MKCVQPQRFEILEVLDISTLNHLVTVCNLSLWNVNCNFLVAS